MTEPLRKRLTRRAVLASALGGVAPTMLAACGGSSDAAEVTRGEGALSLSDNSLSVTVGVPATVTIVNRTALPSGSWSVSAPSSVTVTPNSGSSVSAGGSVMLSITASSVGDYALQVSVGTLPSMTLTVQATATPAPGPTPAPTPAPAPGPPPAPGTTVATVTLVSAVTNAVAPFTIAHVLRKGDIPASLDLVVSGADAQAVIKNTWPDGSAKIAIISGTAALTGNVPKTLALSAGTAATGAGLSTSDLRNAMTQPVSIGFGAVGTATWSGADWQAPFQTLVTGHRMSSWTYRKPIGGDAHLVAWLEVRYYAGGAVEVLPWIENGFLGVATPTQKSGRVTFSMGGTTRYDSINDANTPGGYTLATTIDASGNLTMPHHTRAVLVRGGTVSHWLGTTTAVVASHDRGYLIDTKLCPAYHPTSITESSLAALSATYNPGRLTYTTGGMGGTGYAPDIGLLPHTSAMWLVSGDSRAYRAVIAAGFSLSNYCIHYRDEATNRPLLFSSHPNKSLATGNGVPAGGGPTSCLYASSHHPAAAYLPYLLTGWNWFLEELQFQVTAHYLARNEAYRKNANYYFYMSAAGPGLNENSGLRAQGWQFRSCAMAAALTPDSDTAMRAQYVNAVGYNAGQFRDQHENGNADNPFGKNTLGAGGKDWDIAVDGWGVWQDAFFTVAVGFTWDLDVITDATAKANLLWLRDFKYKVYAGLLGRSGITSEYSFTRAANYNGVYLGTGSSPGGGSFTWFTTMGQVWTQTWGSPNTDASANTLVGGNIESGTDGLSTSYWGNIQPAIAYAVSHGAPGALEGYNRMVNATNWSAKVVQFRDIPTWGIKPRNV